MIRLKQDTFDEFNKMQAFYQLEMHKKLTADQLVKLMMNAFPTIELKGTITASEENSPAKRKSKNE